MSHRNRKPSCGAVIVAAGSGRRMKLDSEKGNINKVFLQIGDMPVLAHTLRAFEECGAIDEIAVVTRECDIPLCIQLVDEFNISKIRSVVCGGDTRQQSVQKGLFEIEGVCDFVAIHDGARCLITPQEIEDVVLAAHKYGAAAIGTPCNDTLKRVGENAMIIDTVSRENVYRVQTPQVFYTSQIISAHEMATEDGFSATDDCSVAEHAGIKIKMVDGSALNMKITTQEDLRLAKALIER